MFNTLRVTAIWSGRGGVELSSYLLCGYENKYVVFFNSLLWSLNYEYYLHALS